MYHWRSAGITKYWPRNWRVYEQHNLPSETSEFSSIISADQVLMDDEFLDEFVRPQLDNQKHPRAVFRTISRIIDQRVDRPKSDTLFSLDKWFERTEHNSQSLITLSHIVLDFMLKCEPSTNLQSQRISIFDANEELRQYIEPCVEYLKGLLGAIPVTQLEVYRRMTKAVMETGTSKVVREGMVKALHLHRYRFTLSEEDLQRLIDCVSTVQADGETLERMCRTIICLSSRLPKSDANRIHIGYRSAISVALERIADGRDWDCFRRLLNNFASFADGRVVTRILTADMLGHWKELASDCDGELQVRIAFAWERLRALAGIAAPRVDFAAPETKMDVLMYKERKDVTLQLPAWVNEKDRDTTA
ncbi:hypothetical protein WOLCODRAFT_20610 [Wolfiporia cocos MD-104 SS10]|uniref:Uncharacterized protein n=1 Tax=Wolfiporia cocos (strain MD-104) TaxID=742152 RepID=A0A2H3JFS8_WOLCO|nr:hypothetical protein WOLCODRAFT_20610 [Wolfiporia cocos MD-104 SS10]